MNKPLEVEENYAPVGFKVLMLWGDGILRSPIMGTVWKHRIMRASNWDSGNIVECKGGIHAIRLPNRYAGPNKLPGPVDERQVIAKVRPIAGSEVVISKSAFRASIVRIDELILHRFTPENMVKAVRNKWEKHGVLIRLGLENGNKIDCCGGLEIQRNYFGNDLRIMRYPSGKVVILERRRVGCCDKVTLVKPGTSFHKSLIGYLQCQILDADRLVTHETENGCTFYILERNINSERNPITLERRSKRSLVINGNKNTEIVECKVKPVGMVQLFSYLQMACGRFEITDIFISEKASIKLSDPPKFKHFWESKGVKVTWV